MAGLNFDLAFFISSLFLYIGTRMSHKTISAISIIIFNLVPVFGVAFYNWSPFEMFWLFWMETLIISFFNAIKILVSQEQADTKGISSASFKWNLGPSARYLFIRILIFLFYSIFIIVFIGFIAHKEEDPVHVAKTLGFQNLLFNLALLITVCTNLFHTVKYFFMNRAYLFAKKDAYAAIFDGRQIVIHIATVVGAVGAVFLFKEADNPAYASIWIIAILCLVKCVFELYLVDRPHTVLNSRQPQ